MLIFNPSDFLNTNLYMITATHNPSVIRWDVITPIAAFLLGTTVIAVGVLAITFGVVPLLSGSGLLILLSTMALCTVSVKSLAITSIMIGVLAGIIGTGIIGATLLIGLSEPIHREGMEDSRPCPPL